MIIITGFAPFGGEATNPSWDAVQMLPDTISGVPLQRLQLPVDYLTCFDPLQQALQDKSCQGVLCIGQAGGRTAITPEAVAINRMHAAAPDNAGHVMTDTPILPEGEGAYFSTFPYMKMVDQMREAGIPATVSYHAGTYVCNSLLYRLLHSLNEQKLNIPAGFIHVPYAASQVAGRSAPPPSMAIEMITSGLQICIEAMIQA